MPKGQNDVDIAFSVELETRKLNSSLTDVERTLRAATKKKWEIGFDANKMKDFQKEAKKSKTTLDGMKNALKSSSDQMFRGFDKKKFKDISKNFKAVEDANKAIMDKAMERAEKHAAEKIELEKAVGAAAIKQLKLRNAAADRQVQEELDGLREVAKAREQELHTKVKTSGAAKYVDRESQKQKNAAEIVDPAKFKEAGKELGESFADVASSLKGKDLFGLVKAGGKVAANLVKSSAHGMGMAGAHLQQKGKDEGGAGGAAMAGMGKALSGLGGMTKSLANLGPMLGMVAGGLMSVIKFLIDVDAQGKEWNKTILEGSATADLYAGSTKSATTNMARLDNILENVRDSAADVEMNLSMGTAAKDHLAVINTLSKEGVSLKNIDDRLKANIARGVQYTQGMTQYSDVTKMAIGYSRVFGVSMDEIVGFQAEMMTQLGVSLDDTKLEFSRMTSAAVDSGIAANKFFSIIRGVSSDLALYGTRLGEVTNMLGKMGKVMSARTAEKFMKSFAAGMSQFSTDDRFKMVLLGGPGAQKGIIDDLAKQKADLISKLATEAGVSSQDAEKLLQGGKVKVDGKTQSLNDLGASKKVTDIGSKREAFTNLTQGSKMAKEGTMGAGVASKYMSGIGAAVFKRNAMLKGPAGHGAKRVSDMSGFDQRNAAVLPGGSEQGVDDALKLEATVDQFQKDAVEALTNPEPTESEKKLLEELNKNSDLKGKTKEDQLAAIQGKGFEDLARLMTEAQPPPKSEADKVLDEAAKQGARTQSIDEKMQVIVEALTNTLYKVLMGVWDAVADLADKLVFGGKKKQEHELEKAAVASKNKDVQDALEQSGGDIVKFQGALTGGAGAANFRKGAHQSTSEMYDLQGSIASEQDPKKKKELMDKSYALGKSKMEDAQKIMEATTTISPDQKDDQGNPFKSYGKQKDALGALGPGKFAVIKKQMEQLSGDGGGKNYMDTAKDLGIELTPEDIDNIMTASMSQMDGVDLAKTLPGLNSYKAGAATPTTGQTASAAKAVDPATLNASATGVATPAGPPPGAKPEAPPQASGDAKQGQAVIASLDDQNTALRQTGIKLDKTMLANDFQKNVYEGTLAALRKALFEYALYTADDPDKMIAKMEKSGLDAGSQAEAFVKDRVGGNGFLKSDQIQKNASGGVVDGIRDGMAMISPAKGEGLASIGPGEVILPAGGTQAANSSGMMGGGNGGNTNITVQVNGIGGADLAAMIKVKVAEGVYEYKKREKLT